MAQKAPGKSDIELLPLFVQPFELSANLPNLSEQLNDFLTLRPSDLLGFAATPPKKRGEWKYPKTEKAS